MGGLCEPASRQILFKLVVLLVVLAAGDGLRDGLGGRFRVQNLEPTAGFEPATRCLQIRRQLNSAAGLGFPCIPRMSIESKEFHSGDYNGGYRKTGEEQELRPSRQRHRGSPSGDIGAQLSGDLSHCQQFAITIEPGEQQLSTTKPIPVGNLQAG
jgi:hypothetical protein